MREEGKSRRFAAINIRMDLAVLLVSFAQGANAAATSAASLSEDQVLEWTVESNKEYFDPFNDVDVDVVFSDGKRSWRVPAFWRGGQKWTVRFAPPSPGEYDYHLESTDRGNPDLNGRAQSVRFESYRGTNTLLKRGPPRVNANGRYFEHRDGTPFFWLADTWWHGLSSRLSWEGFQVLTADRKAKGFTVVQIIAGLVPWEELAPTDPGFCNEGGCVWDSQFNSINPSYFDAADRRVQHLINQGLVPAVVGGWSWVLPKMGVARMRKHWRYLIARYGAYPVFWIAGGEVMDPPQEVVARVPEPWRSRLITPGWTEVARYIRALDPYSHPLTAHEWVPPVDTPLQGTSVTDFDLIQSGHFGAPSLAVSVGQLNLRRARTGVIKPVVQGEIGYENLFNGHFEDFQRAAFWLSMLNGAAGHTYGADGTYEAYTGDKPLHRIRHSFRSWEEGMRLPGSYQVGLGANLLRQYRWWLIEPHPEWVTPRGTTLLESRRALDGSELGSWLESSSENSQSPQIDYPLGEWKARNGTTDRPYAAGIPGEVRLVYIPSNRSGSPTVLGLERHVRYHAYFWQPSLGIQFDLGVVERPELGKLLHRERALEKYSGRWIASDQGLRVLKNVNESDMVAMVDGQSDTSAALVLRYQDTENSIAAVYASAEKEIYLIDRYGGNDSRPLGKVTLRDIGPKIRLMAEVRGNKGIVSLTDGVRTYSTPIVKVTHTKPGSAGVRTAVEGPISYGRFELRRSHALVEDGDLRRDLRDAQGQYRGRLVGAGMGESVFKVAGWGAFGREKSILLDAYQPPDLPTPGDWVLVLDAQASRAAAP